MRTDDGLLTTLYDGMFEQPLWAAFLAALRSRSGADAVSLLVSHDGSVIEFTCGGASERYDAWLTGMIEGPAGNTTAFQQMRPGRVYDGTELLTGGAG